MARDSINRHPRRAHCFFALSFLLCSTVSISGCSLAGSNDISSKVSALASQGKNSELLALSENELKSKPDDPNLLAYRGVAQLRLGKADLAKADLLKAISLDGKAGWYHRELGNVYSDQGKYRDAIASFDNSLLLDSSAHNSSGVYAGRAYANLCLREPAKAVADATEAIKLDPAEKYTYVTRAEAYSELGEFEKGFLDANKAIELDGNNPSAYVARAKLYLDHGDCEHSYTDALKALSLDKKCWRAKEYLSAIDLINGDSKSAINRTDQLIAEYPDSAMGYSDQATIYFCMNDLKQAAAVIDRALVVLPDKPDRIAAWHPRIVIAARLGDEKKVLDLLDRVKKLDGGEAGMVNSRALALVFLKKYQEAIVECEAVLAKKAASGWQPKSGVIYRIRSEAYRRLKMNELADGDMKKALAEGYQKRSVLELYLKLL